MGKVLFFIVLFAAVFAFSQTTKTTLKESFLPEYVAQKENVNPDDIRRIVLKKDKAFKHGVILLNSLAACGSGLCTYYTFVKNPSGSFDFAGMIDGVFAQSKSVKDSDLPEIITETKSADAKSGKMTWNYNKVTKVYEVK